VASDCAYRYFAYGLITESAIALPELTVAGTIDCPAVRVRTGQIEPHPLVVDEAGRGFWIRGQRACYSMRGVGTFLVTAGEEILVDPHPTASPEMLRVAILGPAFALLLHQRGRFILHASAVVIGGAAVAFMGGHGWGKSTMAALLHARGHTAISDDLTAIDVDHGTVYPAFPQLKLWPDALASLSLPAGGLPQVHPDLPKRALRLTADFAPNAMPLQRLYVLGIGQPVAVMRQPPTRLLEEVMRHWYGVRFGRTFWNSLDLRRHFLEAARLIRMTPTRRLQRPATLLDDRALPDAIEREILEDLESP